MGFLIKIERRISGIFSKYGHFIAGCPYTAITVCLLLNGLLSINIQWLRYDSDIESLYTPTNSQADRDRDRVQALFPDTTGNNYYQHSLGGNVGRFAEMTIKRADGNNVLNRSVVGELKRMVSLVSNISVSDVDHSRVQYDILCAKRDGKCVTDGHFLLEETFWNHLENGLISENNITEINLFASVIGRPNFKNNTLTSAVALKLRFNLRQDTAKFKELSKKWEKVFLETVRNIQSNDFEIAYQVSDSLNNELGANIDGDIQYFALTLTVMVTYASFIATGGNCVSNRVHLGLAGVISVALAILGTFGLMSALHVEFVSTVGVMPFLIIGIGVNHMCVLLSGHAEADPSVTINDRIASVTSSSGVSVTVTSLTNVITFIVGVMSVFKSVRIFCTFTATALGLCYFNLITFFLGCLVLHERRVSQNRHCLTCITVAFQEDTNEPNKSYWSEQCCTGSPSTSRAKQESLLEKLPRLLMTRLLMNPLAKMTVILGYTAYLTFSVWGVVNLQQSLDWQNMVSESSYYYKFSHFNSEYYETTFPISLVLTDHVNYSSHDSRREINSIIQNVAKDIDIDDVNQMNWLISYQQHPIFENISENTFVHGLHLYLNQTSLFKNDVVFNDKGDKVVASRFHFLTRDIKQSYQQGQFMIRMRELASTSSIPCFAYSPRFVFFEQFVSVLPSTLQTVGIAVPVLFVVACLMMPNPFVILSVSFSLASMILGVLGFLYFWDVSLNSITMIYVIMSLGFSVDYSVHICHAFHRSEGPDRNARVGKALESTVGPVFNSAVSSVLGIVLLTLSTSYVFTSFFRVMMLVIIFGLFHSLFVLPVVLSLIAPNKNLSTTMRVVYQKNEEDARFNNAFVPD